MVLLARNAPHTKLACEQGDGGWAFLFAGSLFDCGLWLPTSFVVVQNLARTADSMLSAHWLPVPGAQHKPSMKPSAVLVRQGRMVVLLCVRGSTLCVPIEGGELVERKTSTSRSLADVMLSCDLPRTRVVGSRRAQLRQCYEPRLRLWLWSMDLGQRPSHV